MSVSKLRKSIIYADHINKAGTHLEEWSVIEVKKFEIKEINANLEEAAIKIKEL